MPYFVCFVKVVESLRHERVRHLSKRSPPNSVQVWSSRSSSGCLRTKLQIVPPADDDTSYIMQLDVLLGLAAVFLVLGVVENIVSFVLGRSRWTLTIDDLCVGLFHIECASSEGVTKLEVSNQRFLFRNSLSIIPPKQSYHLQ